MENHEGFTIYLSTWLCSVKAKWHFSSWLVISSCCYSFSQGWKSLYNVILLYDKIDLTSWISSLNLSNYLFCHENSKVKLYQLTNISLWSNLWLWVSMEAGEPLSKDLVFERDFDCIMLWRYRSGVSFNAWNDWLDILILHFWCLYLGAL